MTEKNREKAAAAARKADWDEVVAGTGHPYQPTESTKLRRLIEIQKEQDLINDKKNKKQLT